MLRFFSVFLAAASALAADWPCFRGPDGLGVSSEDNLPVHWTKETAVWHMKLPGKGASSPCVVGDRVYLTSQTEDSGLHLIALSTGTGEILWDREIGRGKLHANNLHNMATPTAGSDGNSVWVMFGTGDLACLDRTGKILWQRNLVKEYGEYKTNHGYGSSPMLLDGKLVVVCMHQGPSYVLTLDAKTGKNIWKKDRTLDPRDEAQDSYSSPILFRKGGVTEIVVAGAEGINAYNPDSGSELWMRKGLKVPHPYGRTISGAAAGNDVLIAVASGFQNRGYMVAFQPEKEGDLAQNGRSQLWTQAKFSPDCPTPVVYQDKVFAIRDDGMASCLDLKSGKAHWQERLFTANVKVSPVAGDGKIYFTSGQSTCIVLKAAPQLEILGTNDLSETTLSSPAISQGKLFFRTQENIYCVGKK